MMVSMTTRTEDASADVGGAYAASPAHTGTVTAGVGTLVSDGPGAFARTGARFLGKPLRNVEWIDV